MGFLDDAKDKLTDAVDKAGDKIGDGLDKAGDVVDDKTGGKYDDKIDDGRRQGQGRPRQPRRQGRRHQLSESPASDDDLTGEPHGSPPGEHDERAARRVGRQPRPRDLQEENAETSLDQPSQ